MPTQAVVDPELEAIQKFGGTITQPQAGSAGTDPEADAVARFGGTVAGGRAAATTPSLLPGTPSTSSLPAEWAAGGGRVLSGLAHAAIHPIDTAENIADVVAGASPVAGPPGSYQETVAAPKAKAVGEFYKEKYGSPSKALHTAVHDPLGTAADISAVAAPTELGLRGAGEIAEAAGAARVASGARTAADVAQSVGTATNPMTLPSMAVSAGLNRMAAFRSGLNPAEAAAIDYAINDPKLGPSVDAATASGNQFLKSTKAILQKSPMSAGIAGDAANAQQAAIAEKMGDVAGAVSPGGAKTPLTAGTSAWTKINRQLGSYNAQSKAAFQKLLGIADQNKQTIQVGMKPNPSPDPTAPNMIPVTATVSGPVSTAAVKAVAAPMLDELNQSIGAVAAQASPSGAILRQIMSRPDIVDLQTAINDNSAIQNIARSETPQLKSQAQRISSALVPAYRDAIDRAAADLGPEAAQALQDGRNATISKYELANSLPRTMRASQNPVRLAQFLTAGDDVSVPALQAVAKHVPGALPDVARATLEDIFSHATEKGGISRIDSTINKWNKLGDQTKNILFGPQTTQDVNNLLQYAKMATSNANPSGSATVGSVAGLAALLLRDPMSAIAAMAGSRAIARGIFNPDVAASVRATGQVPLPSVSAPVKTLTAPVTNPEYLNVGRATDQPLNK